MPSINNDERAVWTRVGAAMLATAGLALTGCFDNNSPPPPASAPPPARVGQPGTAPGGPALPAPTGKVVEGGSFNKLFPKDEAGSNVVFSQEKKGYAQAILEQNKKKVATLNISDIAANPEAIQKYAGASKKIAGYPAVAVGSQGTAILVGNRFQVQVRSEANTSFSEQDRENWLAKFKLDELARMGGK